MKTLGRFILIDNNTKKQTILEWKNTRTHNNTLKSKFGPAGSYSERKNIMAQLHGLPSIKNIENNCLKNKRDIRTSSSTNKLNNFMYTNPELQNRESKKNIHNNQNKMESQAHKIGSKSRGRVFQRAQSVGCFIKKNFSQKLNRQISEDKKNVMYTRKLELAAKQALSENGRILCVFRIKKTGLKSKVVYDFVCIGSGNDHQSFTTTVKQQMFKQFLSLRDRNIYLFHVNKTPINNVAFDLGEQQNIIFADLSPKLDISFEMQNVVYAQMVDIDAQLSKKNKIIGQHRPMENYEENMLLKKGELYEWQRIKNIKQYTDKLIANPQSATESSIKIQPQTKTQKWLNLKYRTNQSPEKQDRNPFIDIQCHFSQQNAESSVLEEVSRKIGEFQIMNNKHQIKAKQVFNFNQKNKKEVQDVERAKKEETQRIKILGYKCEKKLLQDLDAKNSLLCHQNLPYIMEKYGISRAQAYNLYTLYKSLEKISAMRLFESNMYSKVKQIGIDRQTFDQGLKGLQINPGEELVRNICSFPSFVRWQEFIKIVSISMRKTPKSKLEAILQGLGSDQKGYLSIEQIDIMVGSSLKKIFGRQQKELKEYFVQLVMKKLDKDLSGNIEIEELKEHVLEKGIGSSDLVSYLMLHS